MEHYKLLIVGAGASGIAAAVRLLEKGFSNFRIIEAENRIGGRIRSTCIDDIPVELGAEWIHGETGNVVYELASKFNLADNTTKNFFNQTMFFEYSGNQVNMEISQAFTRVFDDIMNVNPKDVPDSMMNLSIGEYFDRKFENAARVLKSQYNVSEKLCRKFCKLFEDWENSIDGSHSWYETSLLGHFEYWECPGNLITRWKNNWYHSIFDLLTKKNLGPYQELSINEKIFFDKEVSSIRWNQECVENHPNIELKCGDGSMYSADYVLLTCSLGVLKERGSTMFSPPLPSRKMSCIENLGFGTVDKIFLRFKERWWKNNFEGFAFLWSEEERRKDHSGWLSGVICFHPLDDDVAVLRGWITGEAAQCMESLSSQEIIEGLNYLFDKFLGSTYTIPSIEVCLPSKWFSNPHFRGSYSCRLLKSERTNVWSQNLAEPVFNIKGLPVLFFGGEATSTHFFSTVHGAVESGWREADRLLPFVREIPKIKNAYQVVIVGAGISGLAAAKTLQENGVNDFILLEAQYKPGGRISTIQVNDYHLELGAQWIHGEKNEVFRISNKNGLLTDEHSSEGEGLYLRENGEIIDDRIIKEVDYIIKDILEGCENYATSSGKVKNYPHSIGEEMTKKFMEYLDTCNEDSSEVKEIKRDLLDWHNRFQLIDNSCSDLDNLSAKAWGLFKYCGGQDYVNFKNGYGSLIDALVKHLPNNSILCSCAVEKIDWAEKSKCGNVYSTRSEGAKITCKNGVELFGRHVIVTCSLGYLKRHLKTLFSPPLPEDLSQAVELLDFGVLDKIFLIYDEPWWEPEVKGFQLVWSHDKSSKAENYWGKYVTGFDVIMKHKPVLLGWIGGEGAKMVERFTEEKVGRDATELLRQFHRKSTIPLPKKVIRSTWWSNEYVRGGYSHITVNCDDLKIDGSNLARPVYTTLEGTSESQPTILLAGESTHKNHFSTVHGAFESGQNQARVILDHIKSYGSALEERMTELKLSNENPSADIKAQ